MYWLTYMIYCQVLLLGKWIWSKKEIHLLYHCHLSFMHEVCNWHKTTKTSQSFFNRLYLTLSVNISYRGICCCEGYGFQVWDRSFGLEQVINYQDTNQWY